MRFFVSIFGCFHTLYGFDKEKCGRWNVMMKQYKLQIVKTEPFDSG
ncbi:hypothetical protein bcere0022_7040 [Bacillus cereus Rock3-44]|nr:hypothetical protein bcere0022_7040 [Bacillus cereus Rock3-44]